MAKIQLIKTWTMLTLCMSQHWGFELDPVTQSKFKITHNDIIIIPWILSEGSFVCPAIDKSLFPHGICSGKKFQNQQQPTTSRLNTAVDYAEFYVQYEPMNGQHKGLKLLGTQLQSQLQSLTKSNFSNPKPVFVSILFKKKQHITQST